MPPRFGPEEKDAALILDAAPRRQGEIAPISHQPTPFARLRRRQKGRCPGRIRREDHRGGGSTEHVHGGRACDRRRLDHFAASGTHLAQAVMDGTGAASLQENLAQRGTGAFLGKAAPFARHVPDAPRGHGAGKIGTAGRGHLVREGVGGDGGAPEGLEAAVEIGARLDGLAGTGGRQRQAQAQRRDEAQAATKLRLGATGLEQRCGKHPWERVRDHAQLSVIHLRLLSLQLKPHTQWEFRMDCNKNLQQNQMLKSTYL